MAMQYILNNQEIFKYRPKPFFFITTDDEKEFSVEKIHESLLDLKNCGFGGFVLFNKPPTGFNAKNYLSDSWFSMVRTFAQVAKKYGLEMWINDGFDYPPGNVAGKIQSIDPTLHQKRIALVNGNLTVFDVPWGFPAFENERSRELFTTLVHEEYAKHVGEYFGNPIIGFFSDADNRRVTPEVMFDKNHPANQYFPWSDDFSEGFLANYGYDILPYMENICQWKNIPQAIDYWDYAGKLYQDWFANNQKWLKKHGLLYTGHTSDSSPFLHANAPRCSCFTEGRFSDIQSIFDYPGTDQELLALDGGKHMRISTWYTPKAIYGEKIHTEKMTNYFDVTQDLRAKQAFSTAFLYNKKEVMCEMFAASNFGVSPAALKQISTFQIMQGVTFVVPHAYHYRFFGETKYFSPPEFSKRGALGYSINMLNDEIAGLCALMSKGKSICPIALLDPTEAVWRNNFSEKHYFEAFAKLNRLPFGYVICDLKNILSSKNHHRFQVVIAAGFSLDEKDKQYLENLGITVLDSVNERILQEKIVCNIQYNGTGTPHFQRKLIDGEEFVFIANVENETPINGTLKAYGKETQIYLYAGEIGYISEKYEQLPSPPIDGKTIFTYNDETDVIFSAPNILPLERFESPTGNVLLKTENNNILLYPFTVTQHINDLTLWLPKACLPIIEKISLNDMELHPKIGKVYDEDYAVYSLPPLHVGNHQLIIHKNAPFRYYDRLFISGEFDVDIQTDKTEYKQVFELYNLALFIPKVATTTLSHRRKKLKTNLSWAEQGQPFYSGETVYMFHIDFPADGQYALHLPNVRDVAEISLNGKTLDKKIKPPYEFCFATEKGVTELRIKIVNSLANAMECYREESGILSGIIIKQL